MKKNTNNKKAVGKALARNTHKRRSKEKARAELLRILDETNVKADALRFNDSFDAGRRARVTSRIGREEIKVRGVFSSSKSGFGFVTPPENEGKRDIFIPEDKTLGAIDGDLVEIIYHTYSTRYGGEKTEGRVLKIVEEGRKTVIGTLLEDSYLHRGKRIVAPRYILTPDDRAISFNLRVIDRAGAPVGNKVEAQILRDGSRTPDCRVIRDFGAADSKEANYEAILVECGITVDFTPAELAEAEFFAALPLSEEGRTRRKETIFTIDGADAKDLDDAVSLRRLAGGGWQLGVHIADVSAYVKEKTHLDRAAMARGTSVYFTDKVVPMLPPALSNGACSLNAGEDKYALSAIINLDADGAIRGVELLPTIINSSVRGVYSEVNEILAGTADSSTRAKYKSVTPSLLRMHELYRILKAKSDARGNIELDCPEARVLLDESGAPVDVVVRERGDAEKMIEQFMLTANEAVARFLTEKGVPCVYRVHDEPPADKLSDFLTYVHNLGFDAKVISARNAEPRDFSRLLECSREKGLFRPVSYTMLRTMSKAKYSDVGTGHFGLALKHYCHFTSPIRRLSDLATHRIIHKVLLENKRPEMYEKYARRAAVAATEAELRALTAERKIENLYKVIYMQDKIGAEFDAVINSVTSFGFFAELDNTCEGLVPISELFGMFSFDEKNLSLRSGNKIYRIGDQVRVRLEEADVIRGKLRFSVV